MNHHWNFQSESVSRAEVIWLYHPVQEFLRVRGTIGVRRTECLALRGHAVLAGGELAGNPAGPTPFELELSECDQSGPNKGAVRSYSLTAFQDFSVWFVKFGWDFEITIATSSSVLVMKRQKCRFRRILRVLVVKLGVARERLHCRVHRSARTWRGKNQGRIPAAAWLVKLIRFVVRALSSQSAPCR